MTDNNGTEHGITFVGEVKHSPLELGADDEMIFGEVQYHSKSPLFIDDIRYQPSQSATTDSNHTYTGL